MTVSQSDIDALLASASELAADAEGEQSRNSSLPGPAPLSTAQPPPAIPRPSTLGSPPPDLARILRMKVPVIVTLAERDSPVASVLSLTAGSIIEFDVRADSEFRLMIANKCVGAGQAVKVGENFGLRLSQVGNLDQRIRAMGGA